MADSDVEFEDEWEEVQPPATVNGAEDAAAGDITISLTAGKQGQWHGSAWLRSNYMIMRLLPSTSCACMANMVNRVVVHAVLCVLQCTAAHPAGHTAINCVQLNTPAAS